MGQREREHRRIDDREQVLGALPGARGRPGPRRLTPLAFGGPFEIPRTPDTSCTKVGDHDDHRTHRRWPHRKPGRAPGHESTTTAELLQAHLPKSKVVKAFNHIYAAELTTHGQPAGTPNRRALVIAGDDASAKATVTKMLDAFGFDTVDAGPLKEGWRIQRDTPGYGPRPSRAPLTAIARRSSTTSLRTASSRRSSARRTTRQR